MNPASSIEPLIGGLIHFVVVSIGPHTITVVADTIEPLIGGLIRSNSISSP